MATEKRGESSVVKEYLSERPYSFNFFQAVSILEKLFDEKRALGEALSPRDEPVSFKVSPGFAFPASEIGALKLFEAETRADMSVSFMGLIGPSGVLPHWYNEMSMDRVRNKDFSLVDFLDMFHHRLISLFYLAWKRSRIAVNYRYGGLDRFSSQFRSLIGLGTSANRLPQGIAIESLLYFSGLLARRIPSVTAIESAVSHIAGQRAVVQQFIERTLQLSKDECTSVGKANSALGVNTICGSQVYENTSKFRVELGPMGSKDFVNFMPEGRLLHSIFALVRFIVGIEYEFDLCLILKRDQVAPTMLGKSTTGFAPQLGWSTWIKAPDNVLPENQRILFQEADVIAVKAA